MKNLNSLGILLISFLIQISINGQSNAINNTQSITGQIRDAVSKEALIGAHVYTLDSLNRVFSITDGNGNFELENVKLGRHRLVCEYLGFENYTSHSFILSSSRPYVLDINLTPSAMELEQVVVTANFQDDKAQNEMVLLGARSFSVEETERYAGSIADPSRMAVSFASVQSSNDLDNDLIVRSNSSVGLSWRLEGVEIENPNHFARIGSSGGGISMLSVNMLSNSDFIYQSPVSEYTNAIAGVFDMRLRKGNMHKNESSFRFGIIGTDIMTEGPIRKGRSSYLVNYRYSTLGILNDLGVHVVGANVDNTFSDLSFKLSFNGKNNKSFLSIWGLGGISSEFHSPVSRDKEEYDFDDTIFTDFQTDMGVLGMSFSQIVSDRSSLEFNLAFMDSKIDHRKNPDSLFVNDLDLVNESYDKTRVTSSLEYNSKITNNLLLKSGIRFSLFSYDMFFEKQDRSNNRREVFIDEESEIWDQSIFEVFTQARWSINSSATLGAGLQYYSFGLNKSKSFNPQFSFNYKFNEKCELGVAASSHSQSLPLGTYLVLENRDLEMLKSKHLGLSLDRKLGKSMNLRFELYHQRLDDVPVAIEDSLHYWMLNDLVGYSYYSLESKGSGKNYGIEISFEKYFDKGLFMYFSGGLSRSLYSIDGESEYSSRYDSRFNSSIMIGKEIICEENKILQLSFRNLFFGGQRYASPQDEISRRIQEYYVDKTSALDRQNDPYLRSDLRVAFRKNLEKHSWSLSLDIQNLFNVKNSRNELWNIPTQEYRLKSQSGLIPVLTFQLDL